METGLKHLENYGKYSELAMTGRCSVYTPNIKFDEIMNHYQWLMNIFRDGIETDFVHSMKVDVTFADNESVTLSVFEYFVNLVFWYPPLSCGDELTSRFFFWVENFTASAIKEYIDDNYLDLHRSNLGNMELNNIIDDFLEIFKLNDEFSVYYMNTINTEDTIKLMNENSEFYQCLHTDFSNIPLDDVKNVGTELTNRAISIIMNSNHCLSDSLRSEEGINRKQLREYLINVGTVVNGDGGVFSKPINESFINGGVRAIEDKFMESSKGRIAQTINKDNVGTSGAFARLLSLNNRDTFLNQNPKYSCNTKNFIKVTIKNAKILDMYKNRYYRLHKDGYEHRLSSNPVRDNSELIGQTVYFRSPITCESNMRGNGICKRCYGDLFYTNVNINIGQMAAELISSRLTQMMLSAKHLLESKIVKPSLSEAFYAFFDLKNNIVKVKESLDSNKYYIIIKSDSIEKVDENDNFDYNTYCSSFEILAEDGTTYPINNGDDNFFISDDLLLRLDDGHLNDYGDYVIELSSLVDKDLFLIPLNNNELSKTLKSIVSLLDKQDSLNGITKDQFIERLIDLINESGIRIDAVHLELLLSNQIRKFVEEENDILFKPDWRNPDEKYTLITLSKSLMKNPSITVSLEYRNLKITLIDPLSFEKSAPSSTDMIFMEKPQEFVKMKNIDKRLIKSDKDEEKIFQPISFMD